LALVAAVLTASGLLAVGAAAYTAAPAPVTHIVRIEEMRFLPEKIEVSLGDRIEFKNADLVPHTATASTPDGGFDSGLIEAGKGWTFVCSREGAFDYRCTFHPRMTGSIRVLPAR
jgi:plastocyanin